MSRILILKEADPRTLAGFDAVIDVRSPAEFAADHAPGAINLPVLSDAERAVVGTIHVQDSAWRARRIGAALVARNIAGHLETALADKPIDFRPLVYCWRGGQRSEAMAAILARVGWRTTVLEGGYRTWRRWVLRRLYEERCALNVVLLDGDTGTAKTGILHRLPELGVQILDLENLAAHRGSIFGGLAGRPQPDQKMFETRLLAALDVLDPARPVVIEAESSRIGEVMVPPGLWAAMRAAPRIEVSAPRAERARYLATAYDDIVADPAALDALLLRLPVAPSPKRLAAWRALIAAGEFAALAEAMIELHYDPAYARGRKKQAASPLAVIDLVSLDASEQARAAAAVAAAVIGRS